jgi:hypothetical protein
MTKTIEIIVSPGGEARLETKGFTGASCRAASQFMEHALGIRQSEQVTAEFYTQETNYNRLQEGQS